MKKVLVTGGYGFIGSHTITVLQQSGYSVIVFDNLSSCHESVGEKIFQITGTKPTFFHGDLRSIIDLEKVFEIHPDLTGVIHFAALKAVGDSCQHPFQYYENNIQGTLNLLNTMIKKHIKNIIFSSSATVYDPFRNIPPFAEDAYNATTNPYGTTKLLMEMILKDLATHKGLNALALRYFNPIGAHPTGIIGEDPRNIPTNLVPYMFRVLEGKLNELPVYGNDYDTPDGTCLRDYIHVMDVANAHLTALEYLLNKGGQHYFDAINLGTGKGTSVLDIITTFETVTQKKLPYKIIERRPGDAPISFADVSKAKKVLGRETQYTVEDALRDAYLFSKQHA